MNNNSLSVLMRMATLGGGAILLMILNHEFLAQVYFSDQITNTGLVFNTAILCYFFYGYFYLKFNDAQMRFFSAVEQLATLHILPRYSRRGEWSYLQRGMGFYEEDSGEV